MHRIAGNKRPVQADLSVYTQIKANGRLLTQAVISQARSGQMLLRDAGALLDVAVPRLNKLADTLGMS